MTAPGHHASIDIPLRHAQPAGAERRLEWAAPWSHDHSKHRWRLRGGAPRRRGRLPSGIPSPSFSRAG